MHENIKSYMELREDIFQGKTKEQTINHLIKRFNLSYENARKEYYQWKKSYIKSNRCTPVDKKVVKKKIPQEIYEEFISEHWGNINTFLIAEKLDISYKKVKKIAKDLGLEPLGVSRFCDYTKEEDEKILEMKNQFFTDKEIAEKLGRNQRGISTRIFKLRKIKKGA